MNIPSDVVYEVQARMNDTEVNWINLNETLWYLVWIEDSKVWRRGGMKALNVLQHHPENVIDWEEL